MLLHLVKTETGLVPVDDASVNAYNKMSKAVKKYSMNGDYISDYYSVQSAHRDTKISPSNIASVCRGERPHAGGYKWEYINGN